MKWGVTSHKVFYNPIWTGTSQDAINSKWHQSVWVHLIKSLLSMLRNTIEHACEGMPSWSMLTQCCPQWACPVTRLLPCVCIEKCLLAAVTVTHVNLVAPHVAPSRAHAVFISSFFVHLRHDLSGELEAINDLVFPLVDKHTVLKITERKDFNDKSFEKRIDLIAVHPFMWNTSAFMGKKRKKKSLYNTGITFMFIVVFTLSTEIGLLCLGLSITI